MDLPNRRSGGAIQLRTLSRLDVHEARSELPFGGRLAEGQHSTFDVGGLKS
jgi:hypothetical protein